MNIKNRNIPYGYKFEKGKITVDDFEITIVRKVFNDYINGLSLLKISNILNDRKIEYLPDQVKWNKNKIKRMIEDKRYLGTEKYPQIIEYELFNKANNVKSKRDTTKNIKRTSYIYNLNKPVVCSECNGQMKRAHHPQLKITEKWICMRCGCSVSILDEDLLNGIKEKLNFLILNPSIVKVDLQTDTSSTTIKTENEINRMLEKTDFDKRLIMNKIFELASLKYEDNVAEQLLNEEVNLFWNQVNVFNIVDFKLSNIIIEKLLLANNIPQAIKLADLAIHMTNGVLNCELICSVLNSVKNDTTENINIDFHCVIDLIDYLEKNFFDTDKVIELEKKYFYVLKLHSKAPERLYECISKNPDVFIEFLKGGFKKANKSKKILNEDEKKIAEFCFELLYNWKKVPGYSNNKLDVEYLKNWFYSVKEKSIQIDRYESAMTIIGAMLFHVPEDPSGLFIDHSVAKILDDEKKDSIRNAYACEVVNSRGVYFVDPTGRPEFELEKKYEKRATEIDELGFFRFAQTLRDIAKSFHFEAISNIEHEKKWREE